MKVGSAVERGEPALAAQRRKPRWGRRIGVALLLLVSGLLVVFIAWARGATKGFAGQIAGYRAAGEPTSVEELNAWPALVTPGENAVPALRAAASSVDETTEAGQRVFLSTYEWMPPLTEEEARALDALVKENAKALESLEVAAGLPGVDWGVGFTTPMMNHVLRDLTPQRTLASLVRWRMLLEHHRGNDAEALRCAERLLFIGRALDHQPTLVSHLVAIGINAMAAQGVARVAPELRVVGKGDAGSPGAATPEQVRAVIKQLLDERALAEGQRRSWVGERVAQIDSIDALADGKAVGISANPSPRSKVPFVRAYFYDNGRVMTAYTTALMRATESSSDVASYRQKLPDRSKIQSSYRYLLAGILVPTLDRAGEQHYRGLADRRMAATVLACRLHAVEHDGRLPRTLEELVPAYLPAVPLDPLAGGGKSLGYVSPEKDPAKPRVYSVGLNAVDHGGAEPDPKLSRRQQEAMSDEVRHLKRQPRPEREEVVPDAVEEGVEPESRPAGTGPG